ncbi:fimbria/pilus outer membrane usher protein [Shewanella algae]|uniref:fimbria/pilus outer membrane usher protein n=1 Tax=Shewanella algae TaxID=38313 RepID=UPI001F4903D2|nr:fimbria/pilus outer membrane usher protein [Shewanella algae]MCE9785981.1 fimbrial biogenesis outer membrane usher protein [Shewanella algae]
MPWINLFMDKKFKLRLLPLLLLSATSYANEAEYAFDESLLLGPGYNSDYLQQLVNGPDILPGQYQVDLFVNGRFVSRELLQFVEFDNNSVEPCIEESIWLKTGVRPEFMAPAPVIGSCSLGYTVKGNNFSFDSGSLRLDLTVPQAYMDSKPRGYTSPEQWDSGETALFVNYNGNYYRSESSNGRSNTSESGYLGLNSGFNLGLWRIRNQSTYQYRDSDFGSDTQFDSLRTYATRALPFLQSELSLGELYTRSTVFGSISFKGFQIQSDTRMLPVSQRGYAPTVTGIAQTTAKVVIKQNGREIYQTTVAAGPFEINDLYPTNYQGDLLVEITEADGRVSSFTVPFSAVPGSMRAGQSQYALSMGKSTNTGSDDYFADFTYQTGLSNALTWNAGVRLADDYLALSSGGVWGAAIGSFGATVVYSHSRLTREIGRDQSEAGWRLGLNYSRAFESGTSVTLAGYKYSTEGFRELSDVFRQRAYVDNGFDYSSENYLQKAEMVLSMSQQLGDWGSLAVSGTKRQYRDGREDDDSYQLGYSNQFGPVSLGVNYSRQYLNQTENTIGGPIPVKTKDDVWSLSLSMPLGVNSKHSAVTGYSHSANSNNYYAGLSGTLDDENTLSYSVNASRQDDDFYNSDSYSASLNKRTSIANMGVNYSRSDSYQQWGGNIRGAVVVHEGGLTLGQSVGDTFAIIEAPGAEGAAVKNNWGTYIDSNGYALMPSLMPYRSNDVSLDSANIDEDVELLDSRKTVTPYAGAAVKLKYETRKGKAALFIAKLDSGEVAPLGASILGLQGENIGTVGQAGLAYVRLAEPIGKLTLKWGEGRQDSCQIDYDLTEQPTDVRLYRLPTVCTVLTNQ